MGGGQGDERYSFDSARDIVTEDANDGLDKVLTTLASYTLTADI
jgi:hypothetical protein